MSVSSNIQRRLKFVMNKTLGDARVDMRVELTSGTDKFTVMSINGIGAAWTGNSIGTGKAASQNTISDAGLRFPFRPGLEYSMTNEIVAFCASDNWNMVMTDGDGNSNIKSASNLAVLTSLNHGTMTNTTAPLTWVNPNSNGTGTEADAIEIWFCVHSGTFAKFGTVAGNAVGGTVTGLTTGTSYDFKVRAVNQWGNGAFSSVHTVSTT